MNADQSIRVKDAAALLGVTDHTIHNYRKRGIIEAEPRQADTLTRYRLSRQSVLKLVRESRSFAPPISAPCSIAPRRCPFRSSSFWSYVPRPLPILFS